MTRRSPSSPKTTCAETADKVTLWVYVHCGVQRFLAQTRSGP
eukprot:CAMPEP_0171059606 /NCGR_PEP_ID=MMETSP0766_2-20121228/3279_1 /TAXON_ID=439317 /ORGANISM="Gambierdiscus australes, Strain CAWD 149" /LENGTH=41 /DNA_ID= /DNA_START= /DNA_END= /DNA_ORIENTATION=